MSIFGACGAFSYVHMEEPPYSPDTMLDFYADGAFSHGCSVDHIIFEFTSRKTGLEAGSASAKRRFDITLENASKFLKLYGEKLYTPGRGTRLVTGQHGRSGEIFIEDGY